MEGLFNVPGVRAPIVHPQIRRVARLILSRGWECFNDNALIFSLDIFEYTMCVLAMEQLKRYKTTYDTAVETVIRQSKHVAGDEPILNAYTDYVNKHVIWLNVNFWWKILFMCTFAWYVGKQIIRRLSRERAQKEINEIFAWTVRMIDQRFGERMNGSWVRSLVTHVFNKLIIYRTGLSIITAQYSDRRLRSSKFPMSVHGSRRRL